LRAVCQVKTSSLETDAVSDRQCCAMEAAVPGNILVTVIDSIITHSREPKCHKVPIPILMDSLIISDIADQLGP